MSSISNPTLTSEQFRALLGSAPDDATNQTKAVSVKNQRATDAMKFQLYRAAAVSLTAIAIYGVGVQQGQHDSISKALKASATVPVAQTATAATPGK